MNTDALERAPRRLGPFRRRGRESDDATKERSPATPRRILRELRPHVGQVVAFGILQLLATPLALLTPIPLKLLIDSVLGDVPLPSMVLPLLPEGAATSTSFLLIAIVVLHIAVVVLEEARGLAAQVLRTRASERMTLAFRAKLFAHVQRLSFAFHDRRGTADSIYRIQYDASSLSDIVLGGVLPAITSAATLVGMIIVVFGLNSQLAIVAMAISPVLVFLLRSFRRRLKPGYRRVKAMESTALGVVQEVLTSFRVVKAFGREETEHQRFVDHSARTADARVRLTWAEGAYGLLVNATTAIGTGAVLYIGGRAVLTGRLTVGELWIVISYLAQLYSPLKGLSKTVPAVQKALTSAERSFELLDEVPDVREKPNPIPIRRAGGDIRVDRVSFGYEPGTAVLERVSFAISPGARVGVAGHTGAGKTTLVGLLMRFYDPDSGRITLDGVDLRDYRLADLRKQFAIVLQEPVLFSCSIAENIAYARPHADPADIEAAARAANAHDFITRLPDGYQTSVGERGMRLSGGERQRLSIARAFLKDAPILILDEPTSSVDVKTEAAILQAMRRLMENRTTFLITHRLPMLADCDVLLVVNEGRITVRKRNVQRAVDRMVIDLTADTAETTPSAHEVFVATRRQRRRAAKRGTSW